jgi:hypothetical protein
VARPGPARRQREPYRLVSLTYTFLKDIEERNQQEAEVKEKGSEFHALRAFSIIPTKKRFQCCHTGYFVLSLQDGWKDVRDMYWRKLFNIQKFETANRKFAGEIVTNGKAVSILMRKPKRETGVEKPVDEKDFDVRWGLDPGRRDMLVAVNQWEEIDSCSAKEFYEEARYTKAKQAIRGWQDRDPRVLEAIRNMPTKKTASLEKLKVYIAFMTQSMDVMLEFSQYSPFAVCACGDSSS